MDNLSPREYLASKGWTFKESAGQLVVKVCPKCGDEKGHFYVDAAEGAFFCHKCQERGNLVTLRRDLGDLDRKEFRKVATDPPRPKAPLVTPSEVDRNHGAFLSSSEAQAYMTGRGFTLETCKG